MTNSEAPGGWVEDKQQRQHSVPAANLKEAWPIAHIDAYREIVPDLVRLHDSLSQGSGESAFPAAIQQRILDVLNRVQDLTQARWNEYVDAAASHPLHADSLRDAGVPEHITYNAAAGLPFLTWLSVMDGPQLNWRQISLNILEDKSGEPFTLTPPFRPVRIESLPADTRRIQITDPVHAATLAVFEVIDAALSDLMRAKASVSARDNWVRIRCVAKFYLEVSNERKKELALDDYKDWVVTLPAKIPILNAPAVIARHAANAVAIQLLAMQTIADFMIDSLDRAEKEPGNATQADMVEQVIHEMAQYRERMRTRADSMNQLLVDDSIEDPDAYVMQTVTRPVPRGTPFIAMIPRASAEAQAVVAEIGASRGP